VNFEAFIGPSYTTRSTNFDAERSVNLYPELDEGGSAKGRKSLVGTPGYSVLATLPASPVRGIFAGDGVLFAVGGGNLYRISLGGSVSLQGGLNSAATPAKMFSNGHDQLLICSGETIFVDDGTGPVAVLNDGYVSATFLDGYFIALQNPTGTNGETRDKIYISSLFDGLTWDPADFQARQTAGDRAEQIISHNQQLWIFGQEAMEVWYNSGNADFPFERINGSAVDIGAWPWTIAELEQSLFFVGSNARGSNVVYRTQGFQPIRVSNHAVENAILATNPNNLPVAYSYTEAGHSFYVLCLPGATWVYDVRTNMWHERGVWNSGANRFDAHDGVCQAHVFADSSSFIGSGSSGKIYLQSLDQYTYGGTVIRRNRRAPYVPNEQKEVFYSSLQVDMEMGTQGSGTPTAQLSWSNDGGHTYSTPKTINLGAPGDFGGTRAIWRRLGRGRNRVFDFTLPDYSSGQVVITGAALNAEPGNA
jgi:hypothetical protein